MSKKNGDQVDFKAFCNYDREHTQAEEELLLKGLQANGCKDALTVGVIDGKRFLVDGFTRKKLCEAHGIDYAINEVEFSSLQEAQDWIDLYGDGQRQWTRTDRNYKIGRRYERRKKGQGGDRKSEKIKGKTLPFDSTADEIARECHCSDKHVKNCARFYRQLEEVCLYGLEFLKTPILTERIRYSKKLLDQLNEMGAGGCQEEIKALLAESDKPISPKMIREKLGLAETEEKPDLIERPSQKAMSLIGQVKDLYRGKVDLRDLISISQQIKLVADELALLLKEKEKENG